MRVTNYDLNALNQFRMSQMQQNMNNFQVQISTGKAFQNVSDNPIAANDDFLINNAIKQVGQYQSNITNLKGYLQASETYIGSAVDGFQHAMEVATQAANGTYSNQDRQSFSQDIENTIQTMVGLANSKYLGSYLFSGKTPDTQAVVYNGTTATYNGSANINSINISPSMSEDVSVTAQNAFVPTIQALIALRDAINTNNTSQIGTAMGNLQQAGETLLNANSQIGVQLNTVDMVNTAYDQNKIDLQTNQATVESADVSSAMTNYMNAQQLYQASILATTKMYQTSLINYMN